MARRRGFFKRARSSRRSYGRRSARSASGGMGTWDVLLYGLAYGAARNPIVNAIKPATNMLPFGQYNDEAGMLGLGLAVKTFVKNPMARKAATVAMLGEAISLGSQITAGTLTSSSGAGTWGQAYG